MTLPLTEPIRGIPLVISGPSGVGKGTLLSLLKETNPQVALSVSMTTRPPRPGEVEGVNYYFVSAEEFEQGIRDNQMVEWAQVYGHYYGTPRSFLEKHMAGGRDVILEIDVQGAASVRTLYPESLLIYVIPPTLEELRHRLFSRSKGSGDNLEKRFSMALQELHFIDIFDYVILNDDARQAAFELNCIVTAARLTTPRIKSRLVPLQSLSQ